LCTFKLKNSAEETYVGEVQVLNLSAAEKATLLWRVKVSRTTPPAPGILEQKYAADPGTPANQMPDLIGDTNSSIVLQSMADPEGGECWCEGEIASGSRYGSPGRAEAQIDDRLIGFSRSCRGLIETTFGNCAGRVC
jgi:hypothetical protein